MKTILQTSRLSMKPAGATVLVFAFFLLSQLTAEAGMLPVQPNKDSMLVSRLLTSKKYKIKIYPGATHEVLFFNASGEEGKVYQFFIFDLEGSLVKQTQIRNKQTTLLTNFNKGCYTFEVFSDDEHIENGTLTIK